MVLVLGVVARADHLAREKKKKQLWYLFYQYHDISTDINIYISCTSSI